MTEENPEQLTIPFQPSQGAEGVLCTWAECSNNHRWIPEIAASKCPGCATPVVAIKMVNCPICNEPPAGHGIRVEHVTSGAWIGKACKGQSSIGETTYMELVNQTAEKYQPKTQLKLDFIGAPV